MEKVNVQIDPSLLKDLVVGEKVFRSTCDFYVTERDLEKAKNELKETKEKRRTCLMELKEMLSEDKRMRYRMDDDYLLRFLRYRKFDVKMTHKCIHRFYTMRNEDPELFTLPSDAECRIAGATFVYTMPYTHDNGEIVFIHKLGGWNVSEISVRDFGIMISCTSDVATMNPHVQIHGLIDIIDFGGISTKLLSELLYPPALKVLIKLIQDIYPWRIKKLIFFNCSALLYASIYVICRFFKKKITDRIVLMRSNVKELHKHVNPAILPKEYGGALDEEEYSSYLMKFILDNKEYLRYENSFIGYNDGEQ